VLLVVTNEAKTETKAACGEAKKAACSTAEKKACCDKK
jgi:hypothetical protein